MIINPKSGNGRAIKAHIDELAELRGIHTFITRKGDDVGEVAKRAARMGADVLGVSGGDGTIGAVAKVAIEHQLPMVVLPGGTRCHFARDIGLEPQRIADSLAGFEGVERRVDVANINGRIFLNNASFGLYADIVDQPDYRDHKARASWVTMRSIASGAKQSYDLQFHKGTSHFHEAVQVLVGVNRYNTLDIFELGHRERLDEGVLHVIVVKKLSDALIRKLLRSISIDRLGKQASTNAFYQWTADSFEITNASKTIIAGVDGEREEYTTPVTIRIMPGALRVFVPAEGERGRRKNPLGKPIVRKVWQTTVH